MFRDTLAGLENSNLRVNATRVDLRSFGIGSKLAQTRFHFSMDTVHQRLRGTAGASAQHPDESKPPSPGPSPKLQLPAGFAAWAFARTCRRDSRPTGRRTWQLTFLGMSLDTRRARRRTRRKNHRRRFKISSALADAHGIATTASLGVPPKSRLDFQPQPDSRPFALAPRPKSMASASAPVYALICREPDRASEPEIRYAI